VMPFIDNYLEHLKICRGVISLAGFSTISETLDYRKPSLVIPIKNHLEQMLNAHMLERLGLANTCKIDGKSEVLERKLKAFFRDEDSLRQRVEKYRLNPKGADEAAEIILGMKSLSLG
jgi:UDP-N-acetylglucosamine--N-acetylmuramyl-(pentapeptide) pyrophosphoryl-undecaprenol N-acetylglucosamine transferase